MKRSFLRPVMSLFLLTGMLVSSACSHYLWVSIDPKSGEQGTTNVYFEGGPGPGDGQYLDPFIQRGTTWIRTLDADKPSELKMEVAKSPGKRWLSASLSAPGPRSIESYGKWGVYRYGTTDVLLHYHAKHFDVSTFEELTKLGRAEQLDLDVVPELVDGQVGFRVLWKGEPVVGRPMAVNGPGFKASLKTDEQGRIHFETEKKGRYTLRTSVEEKETGEFEGKEFQLKRYHATVVLNLPVSQK